jgi:phenylpropionate dioxygenase-like ring-hydroxylating dioxygenase large terminal subunit
MKLINLILPFWYPLLKLNGNEKFPKKVVLFDDPLVIYKNKENDYVIHSDICPHQGASLSKGWITKDKCISCPYHGFEFYNGTFCKIPDPADKNVNFFNSKYKLNRLESFNDKNFLYISNVNYSIPEVFYPPEEFNTSFRGVDGIKLINTNYLSVCENLLDMLHISYVHSFGSRSTPLPKSIKFELLNDYHGRSTFLYSPNKNTISSYVGNVRQVKVENEFILPTTTLTRVYAGNTVKTVFTRSIPVSENKTILYWKIYRNFWINPLGDHMIRKLMIKTLDEDINILKEVYPEHRKGPIVTKYDKTILEFRKAHEKYLNNR